MKILVMTPYYGPGIGGACRLMQSAAEFLIAKGHQVEVLTYGGPMYADCPTFDAGLGYVVHRIPACRQSGRTIIKMGLRLLSRVVARRPDLIFCGVAYPCALLAYGVRRLTGIPYAVYTHGEDVTTVTDSPRKAVALGRALRGARVVMANSRYTAAEVAALGVPNEQTRLVPPGIDPQPFAEIPVERVAALRRRLNLEGRRVVLTVARLDERKGHDMIIQALPEVRRHVPDVHYLILGRGNSERLRRLAEAGGVADRLSILDRVADDDLPALYHLCDVYAMTSRYDPVTREVEGFGMVYLEAGACGKPCIAGAAGGAGDAVVDGRTGLLVPPDAVDKIAAALSAVLTDARLAAAMGSAGRARVRAEYDSRRLLERMEALLSPNPQNAAPIGGADSFSATI